MAYSIFSAYAQFASPLVLGTIMSCPLYGITIAQSIWYFRNYPNDTTFFKCCIAMLFIFDGIQTFSLAAVTMLVYLPDQISLEIPGGIYPYLYFATFTMTLVQSAYTYRVWILSSGNRYVTATLGFLTLCAFISTIGQTVDEQTNGLVTNIHTKISDAFVDFGMGSISACDVAISVSMAYYLNKRRSGLRRTENLVDKLIIYFVGIGILTTIITVVTFITWFTIPDRPTFLVFHSIAGKVYANSLLVTLNSRREFRLTICNSRANDEDLSARESESVPLSTFTADLPKFAVVYAVGQTPQSVIRC